MVGDIQRAELVPDGVDAHEDTKDWYSAVSGSGDIVVWGGATMTERSVTGTGRIITKP